MSRKTIDFVFYGKAHYIIGSPAEFKAPTWRKAVFQKPKGEPRLKCRVVKGLEWITKDLTQQTLEKAVVQMRVEIHATVKEDGQLKYGFSSDSKSKVPQFSHRIRGGKGCEALGVKIGYFILYGSRDGWFYVPTWLGDKVPRHLAKHESGCPCGCFWRRVAFWVKQVALPKVVGLSNPC